MAALDDNQVLNALTFFHMFIILLLKDKADALSIPQSSLSFDGCPPADNKQYRYSIWLWIDLIVRIFKRGVSTG